MRKSALQGMSRTEWTPEPRKQHCRVELSGQQLSASMLKVKCPTDPYVVNKMNTGAMQQSHDPSSTWQGQNLPERSCKKLAKSPRLGQRNVPSWTGCKIPHARPVMQSRSELGRCNSSIRNRSRRDDVTLVSLSVAISAKHWAEIRTKKSFKLGRLRLRDYASSRASRSLGVPRAALTYEKAPPDHLSSCVHPSWKQLLFVSRLIH